MSDAPQRLNAALEGRYAIERELGEGGMATVYLADDLRHERKVALKVLKPELAAVVGAERFLAEIKTTANLQHPHILPLFDSGEADGFLFYVMPYVDGETIQDRIDREKQLPLDEAVQVTTAVANALQAAHDHGIVHRDIKPANILLSRGQPLIADFGIALAVGAAGGSRLTETGLSVGTPYYMSPEQATGDQTVGPASDIYALGAVLYEMLIGDPPYGGSTAQAVLGKILRGAQVTPTALRKSIPANVDAAIRKALERLPADRFKGALEFSDALEDPSFRHGVGSEVTARAPAWNRLARGMAALAAVFALLAAWAVFRPQAPAPVLRFSLKTNPLQLPNEWISLTPDGSGAVVSYVENAIPRLWFWRWTEGAAAVRVQGINGVATDPVVSPDGEEVAYFESGELRVAPLLGGLVRTVAEDGGCCARWGGDGFIYFSPGAGNIQRVPTTGGTVEDVTTLLKDGESHGYFHILKGGDAGVFTNWGIPPELNRIEAIRLSTGERKVLTTGMRSYFTPTGHLVFATEGGQLLGVRFDPDALELVGTPVPLIEGLGVTSLVDAMYSLADNGTLLYWEALRSSSESEFVWVTRTGQVLTVDPGWAFSSGLGNPGWSLSPDGKRVAFRDTGENGGEIWIKELDNGPEARLTFHPGQDWSPAWSPDGDSVIFLSDRETAGGLVVWAKSADGVGEPRLVLDTERSLAQAIMSPDGEWLAMRLAGPPSRDIFAQRPGSDGEPIPIAADPDAVEQSPAISPDGRWIAYSSNETGTQQVYVRPFPNVAEGRWQASPAGGFAPLWSRDGRELFFATAEGLHAAQVETSSGFRVASVELMFPIPLGVIATPVTNQWYDVTPDGERFLMVRATTAGSGSDEPELIVVQNFYEELKRRVP